MAGSSFLLARSPVTPNSTSTHGPATRGIRRSRGSRSGLGIIRVLRSSAAWWPGGRSLAAHCGHLGLDRVQQLVPGHGELVHALVLERLGHVVEVDARRGQLAEVLAGRVVGAVDG